MCQQTQVSLVSGLCLNKTQPSRMTVWSAHSAYYSEVTIETFSFIFNTYQCITMRVWFGHFPQCSVMQFIPWTQFSRTAVEGLLGYAQENSISMPTWQWKCDRSLWHLILSSFHTTLTNASSCISVRLSSGHCHRCSVSNTLECTWPNQYIIHISKGDFGPLPGTG